MFRRVLRDFLKSIFWFFLRRNKSIKLGSYLVQTSSLSVVWYRVVWGILDQMPNAEIKHALSQRPLALIRVRFRVCSRSRVPDGLLGYQRTFAVQLVSRFQGVTGWQIHCKHLQTVFPSLLYLLLFFEFFFGLGTSLSMAEIPSYLFATGYGERAKLLHSSPLNQGALKTHGMTLADGKELEGPARPERIFNKCAHRTPVHENANGNQHPTMLQEPTEPATTELAPRLAPDRSIRSSYPSTLPIFRDEGLAVTSSWTMADLVPELSPSLHKTGTMQINDLSNEKAVYVDCSEEDDSTSDSDVEMHSIQSELDEKGQKSSQPALPPLPTHFAKRETERHVKISKDGRFIDYVTDRKSLAQSLRVLRANHPVPDLCGIFYYEVEVLSCARDHMIGVGYCTSENKLANLPGLDRNSWGYHSDYGRVMSSQTLGYGICPDYGSGDVVGCCIDYTENIVFYTKNGVSLNSKLEPGSSSIPSNMKHSLAKFYPCIGFRPSVSLKINFGQEEFLYDIDKYVQGKKSRALTKIEKFKHPSSELAGVEGEPGLSIKNLISSYFAHMGYAETAKAFQDELEEEQSLLGGSNNSNGPKLASEVTEGSVEEMAARQSIRQYITQGPVSKALELLEIHYPLIFENNDDSSLAIFRLECCAFVELFQEKNTTRHLAKTEDIDKFLQAVSCGQSLWEKYRDIGNPNAKTLLTRCFSLLATGNQDATISALLDTVARHELAEEVNSRILSLTGKEPEPQLKRVAQHAMALVWELQNQGRSDLSVLNVHQDFF